MNHDEMQLDEYGALIPKPHGPSYLELSSSDVQEEIVAEILSPAIPPTSSPTNFNVLPEERPVSPFDELQNMAQQREKKKVVHALSIHKTMRIAFASLGLFAVAAGGIFAHIIKQHADTVIVDTTVTATPLPQSPPIAHTQRVAKRATTVLHRTGGISIHQTPKSAKRLASIPMMKPLTLATAMPHVLAAKKTTRIARAMIITHPVVQIRTQPADVVPKIVEFYAVPHSIYAGQNVTLCIHVTNATRAQVMNFTHTWHVLSDELQCRHSAPKTTTRYTAWVVNAQGIQIRRRLVVKVFHASWMLARVHRFQNDLDKFDPAQARRKE